MSVEIKEWNDVPTLWLVPLFRRNPFPLYRGTLIADTIKEYMFTSAAKDAGKRDGGKSLVAFVDEIPIMTGQLHRVDYLSDYWGKSMGNIGHLVTDRPEDESTRVAGRELVGTLLEDCGMDFVSVGVSASSIMLIRALEDLGFRYAEGFANMVGPTGTFREQFRADGVGIRGMKESDLAEISEAYDGMPFPSRFVSDGGFNRDRATKLYVRRFEEVFVKELGPVFIAEMDGRFAGALIALIDKDIEEAIGIKTNPLSGMGIIIHPRNTRKGVALHLIEHRQDYYKKLGVDWVNFGANFNNIPMILGLTKLGLRHGSTDITMHWRR